MLAYTGGTDMSVTWTSPVSPSCAHVTVHVVNKEEYIKKIICEFSCISINRADSLFYFKFYIELN